jgi:hypothetical protein
MSMGMLEARIRAIERGCGLLGLGIAGEVIGLRVIRQGIGEAWSDDAASAGGATPPPVPPPPCTPDFPSTCACILLTLKATDSYYGDCPIVYSHTTGEWRGSKTITYPGSAGCAAQTIPITYRLIGSALGPTHWVWRVEWQAGGYPSFIGLCPLPVGTTGGTTTKAHAGGLTFNCPPLTSVTPTITGTNYSSIYPDGSSQTVTFGPP